jgi:hypothetical protein
MMSQKLKKIIVLYVSFAVMLTTMCFLTGCVSTKGTATVRHQEKITSTMGDEYHIPKKPIDRHFIGSPWSKQFGPLENTYADEIRVKKEKSLDSIQDDFAKNAGFGLGGQSIAGPMGEVGIEGGAADRAKLEGVEIISAISMADIPFEPNIPYVTEALRLKNFKLKSDRSNKAGINLSAGTLVGSGTISAQKGTRSRTGTEGEGLVVAYKLHKIEETTYEKKESGMISLPLDSSVDFPEAKVVIKARLNMIEPGGRKSLSRNIFWACERAEAKSRDIVAAWVVDIKSLDPKRKSLSIGFPGYPDFEDCQSFSRVIYSYIDPLTDKIHRQKITVTLIDATLSDTMKPVEWDARISLVNESFNIKLVRPGVLTQQ